MNEPRAASVGRSRMRSVIRFKQPVGAITIIAEHNAAGWNEGGTTVLSSLYRGGRTFLRI